MIEIDPYPENINRVEGSSLSRLWRACIQILKD